MSAPEDYSNWSANSANYRKGKNAFISQHVPPDISKTRSWRYQICIPVREMNGNDETDESREMRGKAIDRMTHTYAGAHSVLVIDPELRHLDNDMLRTDPDQFYGCVIRSDWMRRCWTYQEGAMAGRLFALLDTEPVYLTRLRHSLTHGTPRETSELRQELTKWISDLPGPRQTQEYTSRRFIIGRDQGTFAEVWNALVSRTTSREADRYLIFALMLDLVVSPLIDIRDYLGQQSLSVFNSLETVPLDFIYDTDVYFEDCWLPKSMRTRRFSGSYLNRLSFDESLLALTAKSAMAGDVFPGLYLLDRRALDGNELVIVTVAGKRSAYLDLSSGVREQLQRHHPLVLLVKDTHAPDDDFATSAVLFQRISESVAENTWQLRRLCGTSCTLAGLAHRSRDGFCHEDLFATTPDYSFNIQCGKQPCKSQSTKVITNPSTRLRRRPTPQTPS
jgi:hypothetical protein